MRIITMTTKTVEIAGVSNQPEPHVHIVTNLDIGEGTAGVTQKMQTQTHDQLIP